MEATRSQAAQSIRCVGVELGGGKSARTAVVSLDYFPQEKKIFIVEVVAHLQGSREFTGDEELLRTIDRLAPKFMGINAPLSLPPCATCTLKCPTFQFCEVPEVKWMRGEARRMDLWPLKFPTPYTQRAVDVVVRSRLQDQLELEIPLEETFGASRAPLAARMQYLRRHFPVETKLIEVNPRIALAALARTWRIENRVLRRYRELEEGITYRTQILDTLSEADPREGFPHLFLYNEDIADFARELTNFDALMSALMAVYAAADLLDNDIFPYDKDWGRVAYPRS
jgi:hypothetical protein